MKRIGFLISCVLMVLPVVGQGQNDDAVWQRVDSLEKKQYYNQAYDEAQKIFDKAEKTRESRTLLVGAQYLSRIGSQFKEGNADSSLVRYRRIMPVLQGVDQALCRLLIADFFSSYYSYNRYSILDNSYSDEPDLDYSLWSSDRMRDTVEGLVRRALADPGLLQRTESESLGLLAITKEGEDGDLTPTVYDVVVRKAVEVLLRVTPSPLSKIDHPELLYAECEQFETMSAENSDISYFVLKTLQEWESFHRRRGGSDGLMIEHYLYRTEQLSKFLSMADSEKANYYIEQLTKVISRYRSSNDSRITKLYYKMAELLYNQQRYVEAVTVIDTAISLYPESPGATRCFNMRGRITQKMISLETDNYMTSGENHLAVLTTWNIDHVYFRIIKSVDYEKGDEEKMRRILLDQPVVKQWDMPIANRGDYKRQSTWFVIPPVEQGYYLLLASSVPDFNKEGIAVSRFWVDDIVFLPARGEGNLQRGFVVNRTTGKPVAGQDVTLQGVSYSSYSYKYKDLATVKTDRDGYYDFSPHVKANLKKFHRYNLRVMTNYKGHEIYKSGYSGELDNDTLGENQTSRNHQYFLDRPVYKPGDTVNFAFLAYGANRYDGFVLGNTEWLFYLRDINDKSVDTLRLKADDYGLCAGRFVLADDAIPGSWSICLGEDYGYAGRHYFNVEAYKQPKFTIVLSKPVEVRKFGQPAHVEGVAASYSAVPISGADVSWSVMRTEIVPFWRWGCGRWWPGVSNPTLVAWGEQTTNDDGSFSIEFVPQPDSNRNAALKPCYSYSVKVTVTDINGETHEASELLSVGYENSYAVIEKEGNADEVALSVVCRNLDGKPLDGTAAVVVESLAVPKVPKMQMDIMQKHDSTVCMPLAKNEFERLFPMFDYDGTVSDFERWPVEKQVFSTKTRTTADNPYRYSFKGLPAGAYLMKASVRTDNGDTLTAEYYIVYEPSGTKVPVRSSLITTALDRETCEVGQTVHLRVGSRYDDVTLYVLVNKRDVAYRHKLYKVSKGYTEIEIPVTEELLGGFKVEVAAIKSNQIVKEEFDVEVPFSDKKLDVTFETFRDKLEPGFAERWTLRIKDAKSYQPISAGLLMTMYDHALDTYGWLGWNLHPWSQSYTSTAFTSINNSIYGSYYLRPKLPFKTSNDYIYRIVQLKEMQMYAFRRMSKSVAGRARGEDGLLLEAVYEYEAPVIDIGTPESGARLTSQDYSANSLVAVAGVGYSDTEADEEVFILNDDSMVEEKTEQLMIRQNLNTLAFFKPFLRSDDNGDVEISFMVPDLLTEWSIRGLAWTKDLKVGQLSAKAITQKRLMVVPNVPRFLRHGDTCVFSVKVSNMSGKEQDVAVSLQMNNAADGSPLSMICGDTLKHITLRDGLSGEVSFVLAVPRNAIFVANYRVVARGDGCSDGEQAPIALLPNRQLVTESMAFYINGAGEKHYDFDIRKSADEDITGQSTLQHHSLTVDLTPNPIWLAIQSLPYVEQQKNPSNIYLANSVYSNSLSFSIVKNNPVIETMFRDWEKSGTDAFQSELDRNADIKQTVMEATPWLRDAVKEEQRHRQIAQFFDKQTLQHRVQKDLTRLLEAQRSDGSWSWIEGGRWSSLYTTQYILKTFGLLRQQGVDIDSRTRNALNRAMNYVDKETYNYYKKYVKGKDFEPINLDYLYLRSLYPENSLTKQQQEAYDFFYNNAKKHNEEYRSLFTQSMLSVVFNRQGDTKLAREMAVRIREKALYSDEMGMYWRDNISGWCWYERPIETQAMLIRVFDEVLSDRESVARMQQWLLKQKQTTNWSSDVSTVNAIQALMLGVSSDGGSDNTQVARIKPSSMSVEYGSHKLTTDTSHFQLHVSQRLAGGEMTSSDGRVTLKKEDEGIAWGAIYWQYFEQVDKIPYSSMGVTLKRTLYIVGRDGKLKVVEPSFPLKVGDKVRVRLEITSDRNLEYLELKEPRCAAFEPVSTESGWVWNGGLPFYCSITNTSQTLYIDRLDKGTYYVEYDFYVNNAGVYSTAPTTIQCLYAPEFRSLCPFPVLRVE